MRIHRLRLANYRGVTQRELTFRDSGVTIVRGNNETGKSSLREAVDLLLHFPHDSKDRRVQHAKPVQADVGPEVEGELTIGPYRFVYAKRWLKSPCTTLHVLTPSPEHHTGREAHDWVSRVFRQHADPDLWRALHADQGVNLVQVEYRQSRSLVQALDRLASAQLVAEGADDLYQRVQDEYLKYFTDKEGRLKRTHTLLRDARDAAQRRADELAARLAELEQAVTEYEQLQVQLRELHAQRAAAVEQERRLTEELEQVAKLETRFRECTAAVELAKQSLDRVQQSLQARQALIAEVERRQTASAELSAERERIEADKCALAEARAAMAQALETASQRLAAARQRHQRAVGDFNYFRDQHDLRLRLERQAALREALDVQDRSQAFLNSCKVDQALLEEIDRAHLAVEQTRARLELNSARLSIEALRQLPLAIGGQRLELEAGARHDVVIEERTELVLDEWARILVEPGQSTAELSRQLALAEQRLAELLAQGEVSDRGAARRLYNRRVATEAELTEAQKRIRDSRRDLTDEEMERRAEQLRQAVARYAQERPAEPPLPADLDAAQAEQEAAQTELAAAEAAVAEHEAAYQEADRALARVLSRSDQLAALTEQAQRELAAAESALVEARQLASDETLDAEVSAAQAQLDVAQRELAEAEKMLAALQPERLRAEHSATQQQVERLAAEIDAAESRRDRLAERLELLGAEGLHEQAERARADAERLDGEWQRVQRRAAAARLLYEVMHRHREAAHARYHAPLREKIEQLGRLVFGDSFQVELDDQLQIARRTLDGVTLPFADLSTGAREQLCVIERLACAAIVSPEGGAPVILDDALGYSDPERLKALAEVLTLVGQECQIILLTSNPERYRHVANANVVELDAR